MGIYTDANGRYLALSGLPVSFAAFSGVLPSSQDWLIVFCIALVCAVLFAVVVVSLLRTRRHVAASRLNRQSLLFELENHVQVIRNLAVDRGTDWINEPAFALSPAKPESFVVAKK